MVDVEPSDRLRVRGTGISREVDLALQTLDACVPDGRGSYLAAPISTGERYFAMLAETGTDDLAALVADVGEDRYLEQVRWPNVRDGETVAARLRASGVPFLINTGPIFIDGWADAHYMDLCFRLIHRKISRAFFHPGWVFSSGAIQEFSTCRANGIPTLSPEGREIAIADAGEALRAAQDRLLEWEISPHLCRAHSRHCDQAVATEGPRS